ncbi:unnamed protein product [Thlaspi arvense]|uniref:HTH La-type RNA-binding domain-containing protein n=1 Tax=Thlaspi arvense TaxID=13288 RepID=A0AAU9RVM6_THLAR|nr:unnamed protein product [Thlaspi arvense]
MEKEKSDNSDVSQGNAWKKLSNGDTRNGFLAEDSIERMGQTSEEQTIDQISTEQVVASPFTSGNAAQTSGQTQNQNQRNPHKNQDGNNHTRQGHGVRQNQGHVNPHRTFNGSGGFVRPRPPPVQPFYAQYMPVHQTFYPMVFLGLPPPMMMYHPHRMPFKEPPHVIEENLPRDMFLRQHMNDEGFVHIQVIADFNKLKALTTNIQLILDSLRGLNVVEVKGYEIRNRRNWRKYLMPRDLRVTFNPEHVA